jgi:hypothetical protein
MLLDHGIDAVVACILNPIMMMKMMQTGRTFSTFYYIIFSSSAFYYATFEFYYTGELVLAMINGADEGSIGYCIFCCLAAIYGC